MAWPGRAPRHYLNQSNDDTLLMTLQYPQLTPQISYGFRWLPCMNGTEPHISMTFYHVGLDPRFIDLLLSWIHIDKINKGFILSSWLQNIATHQVLSVFSWPQCADSMLPWAPGVFARNFVYAQDNATPHTACDTTAFLPQRDMDVMDWPAPSPYMNSTEPTGRLDQKHGWP